MSGETQGSTPSPHDGAAELDGWVQRYLLAELDPNEFAAFEARLARDPALAQALADGVALFAAVADLPVAARSRWSPVGAWPLRVAAAAVLLVVASLYLSLSPRGAAEGEGVAQAALSDDQADRVLSLWLASVDDESDLVAADDVDAGLWFDPVLDTNSGAEVGEDEEEDEWDIPEWLLLGVRGGR